MTLASGVLYDDSLDVPVEVHAMTGLDRYGHLRSRRDTLLHHARQAVAGAGAGPMIVVASSEDRRELADRLPPDGRTLVWCAELVEVDPGAASRLIARLAWAERDLVVVPAGAGPGAFVGAFSNRTLSRLLRCRTRRDRAQMLTDLADRVETLPCPDGWVGLADPARLARFVSGSFYARAFNRVRGDGAIVVKSSTDVAKMKAEHDWWHLLPDPLKRFAVQPFGFTQADGVASYKMERLHVPDAALLWVHGPGAMGPEDVDALLDGLFRFFAERPVKAVAPGEALRVAHARYVAKVDSRLHTFLNHPTGAAIDALLQASGHPGLSALQLRYHRMREALWRDAPPDAALVVGHGDPCLSNVLFDKRTRLVRLIDPRGAVTEADLWDEPTYDLAKLSHSILGGYDFVNNGLFDVVVDEQGGGLGLTLRLEGAAPAASAPFLERVTRAGFSVPTLRLYEASLFLSMLALHVEAPRRCLGLALTATRVLDEAEAAARPAPGGWASWFRS
jgi:hypothetical protein